MESVSPEFEPTDDQRVFLHGVSWRLYENLLRARGDRSVPRLAFLDGTIELMSPSIDHEQIKSTIGRILEFWATTRGLSIIGAGSWTLRNRRRKRGLEPDECYILGRKRKRRPDLAVEVVWTTGGLDKLPIYEALRVPEVWIWEAGAIQILRLSDEGYLPAEVSVVLPTFDVARLAACATIEDQTAAVRQFMGMT